MSISVIRVARGIAGEEVGLTDVSSGGVVSNTKDVAVGGGCDDDDDDDDGVSGCADVTASWGVVVSSWATPPVS